MKILSDALYAIAGTIIGTGALFLAVSFVLWDFVWFSDYDIVFRLLFLVVAGILSLLLTLGLRDYVKHLRRWRR